MSYKSEQLVLKIYEVFVFVDWFGTLSTAKFWDSIVLDGRHPLARPLRDALETLFRGRQDYVRAWMRGEVSDHDVIESLHLRLPKGYGGDYLYRELLRDCKSASINPGMSALVKELRQRAFIGVASDNMDCFIKATPTVLSGELGIDELIVSSEIGSLKAESPDTFFRPTLERYGLEPFNAVLIDDCSSTCERFREWGGRAFNYTDIATLRAEMRECWPTINAETQGGRSAW